MNEELLTRAVLALESMANPGLTWSDLIALGIGLLQCGLITYGLRMMQAGNEDRTIQTRTLAEQTRISAEQTRTLAEQTRISAEQTRALTDMAAGIRELLRDRKDT